MTISAQKMITLISLCVCLSVASSLPAEDLSQAVDPEYLDSLLAEKKYDEFSKAMGINLPHLVYPRHENATTNPLFNEGLRTGDILVPAKQTEQTRQGIRFDVYGGSKWPDNIIPYSISNQFTYENREKILSAIQEWNEHVPCIKWITRWQEQNYVNFFPGNGCYSYLGRIGNQQPLSLAQNGCMSKGTILHEMDHAAGFGHEQNRYDRDDYIRILFDNIPNDWKSQYEKTSPDVFGLQGPYDYYSVMHYSLMAPYTNKPAYEVLDKGVDTSKMGQRDDLSEIDIYKLNQQYC